MTKARILFLIEKIHKFSKFFLKEVIPSQFHFHKIVSFYER